MRRPLWLRLTGHYPHLMRDGLLTAFSGHSGLIGYTGLMFWFPAEEILGIVLALERLSSTRHATVGHATGHRPISNGLQLAVARRGAVQVNAAPCILTASEYRLQANQREIAS